jgi:TRAP-type C4-dicarboxylate transport system permease small subunit
MTPRNLHDQAAAPQPSQRLDAEMATRMDAATKAAELADPDDGASAVDKAINRVAEVLGVAVLVTLLALVFGNAVGRYLGGYMIVWADEVVISLMPWLGMLGMFLSIRRRQVIRIDYFVDNMPPRLARAVLLFADIMSAAVFLYLAVISFQYVQLFGADKTIYLRIPTGWFSSAMVIGAAAAALAYGAHFVRDFRKPRQAG